jgi:hypothetical protein
MRRIAAARRSDLSVPMAPDDTDVGHVFVPDG